MFTLSAVKRAPVFRIHGARPVCVRCALLLAASAGCPIVPACQAKIVLNAGSTLSTAAGTGNDGRTVAGAAAHTMLGFPRGVAYDTAGTLYIADSRNHQIYRLTQNGSLAVIAGTGEQGFAGDGGVATAALLNAPYAVAIRADGTLFLSDTGNHRIRSISSAGVITTIAGTGTPGSDGDGSPATAAALRRPTGLAFDATGRLLIADSGNHRIRRINTDGTITSVAGTGEEGDTGDGGAASLATFRSPSALLLLQDGSILVSDTAARRIRVLRPDGTVIAFAPGVPMRRPEGASAWPTGDILVSDAEMQKLLQSSVNATAAIAGNGTQGSVAAGQPDQSSLDSPAGVATASDGSIAIADRRNHQVQRILLPLLDFGSIPSGQHSASKSLLVQNGGTSPLQITALTLPGGFHTDATGSCAPLPVRLSAGEFCTIGLVFQPQVQGSVAGLASVTTDVAPTAALRLTGTALPPATQVTSQTVLSSNGTVAYSGVQVQLTALVTGTLATSPAGNVAFTDGQTALATVALASANATYSTAALATGPHTLRAVYSGDSRYASSTSAPVTVTVVSSPDFAVSATATSYSANPGGTIVVPLTCLPQNGTLNHTVTFAVSGLPTGFTSTFAPPVVTLGANAVSSTLTITVPATVAVHTVRTPVVLAAMLVLLPVAFRKRRSGVAFTAVTLSVGITSCGGGFRTVSSSPAASTRSYNVTVSATTTGILGDTLVHSIPVEVVITP